VESQAAPDDPQAAIVHPSGGLADIDSHVDEGARSSRRKAVAAHLLARESRLFQQRDVEPGAREPVRGGAASRAGTDDDDVRVVAAVVHHRRLRGHGRRWRLRHGHELAPTSSSSRL
jgi:hypothetical protein